MSQLPFSVGDVDAGEGPSSLDHSDGADPPPCVMLPNGQACCVLPAVASLHRRLMENYAAAEKDKQMVTALREGARTELVGASTWGPSMLPDAVVPTPSHRQDAEVVSTHDGSPAVPLATREPATGAVVYEDDGKEDAADGEGGCVDESPATAGDGTPKRPQSDTVSGAEAVPSTHDEASLQTHSQRLARYFAARGELLKMADARIILHADYHARLENESASSECYRCRQPFGRRHHCRRCGHQFCAACANYCGRKQDSSRGSVASTVCTEYAANIVALDRRNGERAFLEEAWDTYTFPSTADEQPGESEAVTSTPEADEGYGAVAAQSKLAESGDSVAAPVIPVQRLCARCYVSCLRARKRGVLASMRSANRYILEDGFYYFFVLDEDEGGLATLVHYPEEAKAMMAQACQRALEQLGGRAVVSATCAGGRVVANRGKEALRMLGGAGAYVAGQGRQRLSALWQQPQPAPSTAAPGGAECTSVPTPPDTTNGDDESEEEQPEGSQGAGDRS